tara:strand:+ start:74 stop:334 length:261 start_codon:yes stop_codon:yes gene_type:complete
MEKQNKQLITDLFFEYGISVNLNAYDTNNIKQMESLREIVKQDAIRFLKVVDGLALAFDVEKLVKDFWDKALREGLRNAGKKGWRD